MNSSSRGSGLLCSAFLAVNAKHQVRHITPSASPAFVVATRRASSVLPAASTTSPGPALRKILRQVAATSKQQQRHRRQFSWVLAAANDSNTESDSDIQSFSTGPHSTRPVKQEPKIKDKDWVVPGSIEIPEERLTIGFVRSSGAGGQNVNKVNTKAECRMNVMKQDWIPLEVRERMTKNLANRINKEGDLVWSCQENRTQAQNRRVALEKLEEWILEAYPRPVERKKKKGISKEMKEKMKEQKKRQSDKKANRRKVDY